MPRRLVSWFSCRAASAVASKLTLADCARAADPTIAEIEIVYCATGAEHPGNAGFFRECEAWFGQPIVKLKSDTYRDTWDVWEKTRWLAGINGARCTTALKVEPRLVFQRPSDIHVFGYTSDRADVKRAERLRANYPELTIRTPLIDRDLNKEACLDMVSRAGLTVPPLYGLGFQNNNCIPCVKATSPAYWSLVRKHFPEQFDRMSKLARELDVRLCRIDDERSFIDEIPADHPTTNPIQPSCDFLCQLAEQDMSAPAS